MREVFDAPSPIFLEYEALDGDGNQTAYDALRLTRKVCDPKVSLDKLAKSLLRTVREHTDLHDLDYDQDGMLSLTHGEVPFVVRLADSPPMIDFRAVLVDGVREEEAALVLLNDLNMRCGAARFFLRQGAIFAASDIPAVPFVAEHVSLTMYKFVQLVEGVGEFLESAAERVGPIEGFGLPRSTH